jgi:outer membrane beta-barrel protein
MTGMIRLFLGMVVATATFLGTANAQDSAAATGSDTDAASGALGAAEAAGDQASETSKAEKELENDLAKFWGSRRRVKVVQRRLFKKDGRMELAAFAGMIPNDDFVNYYPVGIRVSYHFSEAFSVEGSFAEALDSKTDLASFLEDKDTGFGLKRASVQEIIDRYFNVNILWAPIYGKISLLGLKLSHFETYVGMGFGMFQTEELKVGDPEPDKNTKPSGSTIFGFRWFLTDMINVRTEYRQYFFQKHDGQGGTGGVSIPVELSIGLGITI